MSQVLELRTLDEIENWVRYISQAIAQEISRIRQSSVERFADEAKAYVASHFRDPNLSVDVICRELHVSPAYFSTIFKRQTGQAFSAYLTEVRLNEALRLLETTNDKTYLITEKVGYSDPNYFSYAFKKQFGISPTQYRKRLTEGSERPETLSQTGDGFTSGAGLADGGTLQ